MSVKQLNIFMAAVLVAIILFAILQFKCNSEPQVAGPVTIVPTWVNQAGDSVTSLKGYQVQFAAREKQIADSIAKVYNVKLKDLQGYIIALEESNAAIPLEPGTQEADYLPVPVNKPCPPPIKNYRANFRNAWYSVQAQIGDSSFVNVKSWDSLTVVFKRIKEGGLFNRKKLLQIDMSSSNPDNKISGLQVYRVADKPAKKFGIGLQAGYGWQQGLQPAPYFGIGISYNVIRF